MNLTLTQENRQSAQFWFFTSSYGISSLFFAANFYSYGITYSFLPIFLGAILLGPLYGLLSVLIETALLQGVERLFGGKVNFQSLGLVLAKSKMPALFSLALWGVLCYADPKTVFIQDISNDSAVIIVLCTIAVIVSSFCLLMKSLQNFRRVSAFCIVFITYWLAFFVYATMLFVARYVYISLF